MTTRSGGRSLIFRAYHGPLTPLVLSPISEGCEGARHFLRADRIQIRFASRLLLPGDPVSNSNDSPVHKRCFSSGELFAAGVRRISLATSFCRAATCR